MFLPHFDVSCLSFGFVVVYLCVGFSCSQRREEFSTICLNLNNQISTVAIQQLHQTIGEGSVGKMFIHSFYPSVCCCGDGKLFIK